jgi:hypothetical protein
MPSRWTILSFAVATAYWPGLLLGSFVPRWAVIAVGVPLCASCDPRLLPSSMRFCLVFLLGLGAVSLLGSPYVMAGIGDLMLMGFLVLSVVAGAELDSLDDVMTGASWGLVISALIACAQAFFHWHALPEASSPSGLFFNSEILGEFAALVFVWAMLKPEPFFAVAAVLCVAMTHSRVGIAASLIGFVYALRLPWRFLLFAAVALVPCLIAMLFLFKFGSAMHRIVLWGAALMHFTIAGRGLGFTDAAFPVEQFVHSDAIQTLVELGLAGLVAAAIPVIALRNGGGSNAERALFVAVCVEVCISFPLHFPATGFLAAIAAGCLARGRVPVCDDGAVVGFYRDRRRECAAIAYPRDQEPAGFSDLHLPVRSVYTLDQNVRLPAIGEGTDIPRSEAA